MSDFLLQKSCKLLLESKNIKKTKKTEKQRLKKKKNLNIKQLEIEEFQNNIANNLKKLQWFNEKCSVDVSDKVIVKCSQSKADLNEIEKEEKTVFTEKDFEDFEKEYFDS